MGVEAREDYKLRKCSEQDDLKVGRMKYILQNHQRKSTDYIKWVTRKFDGHAFANGNTQTCVCACVCMCGECGQKKGARRPKKQKRRKKRAKQ